MDNQSKNFVYKPRLMTLCFIKDGNRVLLGRKARKIGEGLWNGMGGNVEQSDETIEDAAKREVREEVGVELENIKYMGSIDFKFPDTGRINQVSMFVAEGYQGDLSPEPEEISELKWFDIENLPVNEMLEADKRFVPFVLHDEEVSGEVKFTSDFVLLDCQINHEPFTRELSRELHMR